jgi:hypothetical protein
VHFHALSVGVQVPTHHFNGTVHSVFHQACNLWLEPGILLTLLPSRKGNVPQGIRLHTSPESTFVDLVQVGQPVACRGGILRTGGSTFSVDLRSAHPWHIDLQELHIDLRQQTQAHSWSIAWSELQSSPRRSGLLKILRNVSPLKEQSYTPTAPEVLLQPWVHAISALLHATKDFQSEDARASIMPLIGLGPGLTPSGDDFLVGYLAGLWSTAGGSRSRTQFIAALKPEISAVARNTNEISCAYLRSATEGYVAEPIANLAQQLKHATDMRSVRSATHAALQVGHTSGIDGVLGLLLGCIAWQSPAHHLLDDPVLFN